MRVVVAGTGIMGLQIAEALCSEGNQVTAIEIDPMRAERARKTFGSDVVEGDACDPQVLERAGFEGLDAFVALTGRDEDNLVSSLLAKDQFSVPRVVARINDPRNSWLFDRTWGVDVAMSAPSILLSLVQEATSALATVSLMELATANVRVYETAVGPSSPLLGRLLGDLAVPDGVVIATLVRGGRALPVGPETELRADDRFLVVAERDAGAAVDTLFAAH